MDPSKVAQDLGLPLDVCERALSNIASGKVSWIVVSGKLCSGKDTVAPLIQPALGFSPVTRLGFGDTIRVEANQVIKLLTGRTEPKEELVPLVASTMNMKPADARELVDLLADEVRDPLHKITAEMRTDLMRKILVKFGSDWRTVDDPSYWARQLAALSVRKLAEGVSVYLTGGRFEPDVEIPRSAGARIIRLDVTRETQIARLAGRDGLAASDALDDPSETALDEWPFFDVRVNNDGTLDEGVNAVVTEMRIFFPVNTENTPASHPGASFGILPPGRVRPTDWVIPEGMRFVFGIDLDNVCADYDEAFRWHVARVFGVDPSTLGPVFDWDFSKIGWGIRDRAHFEELHLGAVRNGMFRTMPMIEGASSTLRRLSDAGVHNRIVTHRLFIKGLHAQSAGDTVEWLEANSIPYRSLCMVEAKADIEADIFVDDAPHNVANLRKAGKKAVVFDTLFNQAVEGLRAHGWAEVYEIVMDTAYAKAIQLGLA